MSKLPDDTHIYCGHEYTVANPGFALQVEPRNMDLQRRMDASRQLRARPQPTVPSLLGPEKLTNPFLRYHQPEVLIHATEKYSGEPLKNSVEVFTVIRAWNDRV